MSSSDEPTPSSPLFTVFMIVALLALWGLVMDAIHTSRGGSIDLRNRITGVRLASEQRDPYFYKWTRLEDERFCDPFNAPGSAVSHTTVTPLTLTVFYPLQTLPYRAIQWVWFAVQYALLGLGFQVWARRAPRGVWLAGGLLTCLFCLTPHWRFHMDRGQSYVLYASLFLFAAHAATGKTGQGGLWKEGLTTSLLALLRPTYGVLLGISATRRKGVALAAAGIGLLLGFLLPVLLAGPALWQNYFKAMAVHAQLYLSRTAHPKARFSASETIEGIPIDTWLNFPRIPFSDTSIYRLISFQLQPAVLLGTWAVLAALSGFLFLRRGEIGTPRCWWALSAWVFIGDYLLPAYRYPYNHILLWPVLLLGLTALPDGRPRSLWFGLGTMLLALHAATWFLPHACISWPGVASLVLAIGVAAAGFVPPRRASSI